jgi:superfamily II DNA/RNA helicase
MILGTMIFGNVRKTDNTWTGINFASQIRQRRGGNRYCGICLRRKNQTKPLRGALSLSHVILVITWVTRKLRRFAAEYHGQLEQQMWARHLYQFLLEDETTRTALTTLFRALVAADMVSRGLDLAGLPVTMVHCDFPWFTLSIVCHATRTTVPGLVGGLFGDWRKAGLSIL